MRGDTNSSVYFKVTYMANHPCQKFVISCDNMPFVKDNKFCNGRYNFIGKWEEWNIYEQLEKDACNKLKAAIDGQKARAQKQIDRLNNIIKEDI